jgi:hypothetical protein
MLMIYVFIYYLELFFRHEEAVETRMEGMKWKVLMEGMLGMKQSKVGSILVVLLHDKWLCCCFIWDGIGCRGDYC